MKERVLNLLKEFYPEFVSGEVVCKNLGISRTAVWKHIRILRAQGYDIAALPHTGYQLLGAPDRLYPEEIHYGLKTDFIGRKVYYYERVNSTNEVAKELAGNGALDGSLVIAEEQTAGRGRLGRSWFSSYAEGICCSIILYPPVHPVDAIPLTMLSAVAVARAIQNEGIKIGIKWPNDILIEGKKVCGILTEMNAEMERVNYLVVGMGINVNVETFPEEIINEAASLKTYTGRKVSRIKLLHVMLNEMEQLYSIWLKHGFKPVLQLWRDMCMMLNCPVRISGMGEVIEGWSEDVDESGKLILRLPDGSIKRLIAGEVSLRKI